MSADKLLSRPDLAAAAGLFAAACGASRAHSAAAQAAIGRYGDHGSPISGCIREHFPEPVKDGLRAMARAVADLSDMAWSARPARVRADTIRALSRAVARRDGSGFYGPQA